MYTERERALGHWVKPNRLNVGKGRQDTNITLELKKETPDFITAVKETSRKLPRNYH